jgi:hypothetical protein
MIHSNNKEMQAGDDDDNEKSLATRKRPRESSPKQRPDAAPTIEDARECTPGIVFQVMHRTFLLHHVRDVCSTMRNVCVPLQRSRVIIRGAPAMHASAGADAEATLKNAILRNLRSPDARKNEASHLFTWKAKGSRVVTLFKKDYATTIIWDHASDCCFAATPCASLGPGCPTGTAFLAQVVLDRVPGTADGAMQTSESASRPPSSPSSSSSAWIPNILVFDIIQLGENCNFSRGKCPATERYSALRNLNEPSKGVFTSQHIKVQWAGLLPALVHFHANSGQRLSHILEDYIRLGYEDPFDVCIVRCMP